MFLLFLISSSVQTIILQKLLPNKKQTHQKQTKTQHLFQYGQTLRLFSSQISALPRHLESVGMMKFSSDSKVKTFFSISDSQNTNIKKKVMQKAVVPHLYWDSMRSAINTIPQWDVLAASNACWLIQNCHCFSTSHYDFFY